MKLFTKRQIEGALKACHLYETLAYPSTADFEALLQVGGIGGCTITVDDAKVAHKIWGASVPKLKGNTVLGATNARGVGRERRGNLRG
jgi:hypothetical protein